MYLSPLEDTVYIQSDTAVSTKIVQKKRKSVRDNAER